MMYERRWQSGNTCDDLLCDKPIDAITNSPYWTPHGDPLFQRCHSSLAGLPLEPPCTSFARIGTKQAKGLNA